jgi:hypothetical protein
MRLVDIDELAKHEHWKKTVNDLRCAPIVDAIPIDWLKEKLTNHPEIPYSTTDGIITILNLWEEKNEID